MSEILATAQVVSALVARPDFSAMDVPYLIKEIHQLFCDVGKPKQQTVFDDYLVCLIDGKKVKNLRAYLKRYHQMAFAEYIEKYNLPKTYPPIARSYSEKRSRLAKEHGLGVKK
jgi:predicted transcriptional regulator